MATFEDIEESFGKPSKKLKENTEVVDEDGEWIVINKKKPQLTISIADYSKINKYYSHRSLQSYLRYLLTQTCPNPMWLTIKRQSLIDHIVYIDLEIENCLCEEMLANKQLQFLSKMINITNKVLFKQSKFVREDLWDYLFSYCQEKNQFKGIKVPVQSKQMSKQLFQKYQKYMLTGVQLKANLYPCRTLPVYADYLCLDMEIEAQSILQILLEKQYWTNNILVVDCEMVTTRNGFELARATIINYNGETVYDQFFKPSTEIISYNTEFSGITAQLLDPVTNTIQANLHPFMKKIINPKTILIGHSLQNDLNAMKMIYQRVIDTSVLYMRKNASKHKLKNLSQRVLNRRIQVGTHDSIQDCLATLHLVQAKIQNQAPVRKQYNLLGQLLQAKKSTLLIDYDLDNDIRQHIGVHFQKIRQQENIQEIFRILKKYLRTDVSIPAFMATRILKSSNIEWQQHYRQFDNHFKQLYESLPKFTAIFVNCQINDTVSIVLPNKDYKPQTNSRPFCLVLAR